MQVTGLNHITINVRSLEASRYFYREVLSLKEAGSIDMGDHTLTYFSLPQGVRLELIDYTERQESPKLCETAMGIYRHFCLEVASLLSAQKECEDAHVPITKRVSWVEKLEAYTMLILDPNGVEIELIEKGGK